MTVDTQKLIDRHEVFKCKGLQLTDDDLFNWVRLWEEMLDAWTNLNSEYQEDKQQLEVDKWIKMIALKTMLTADNKKVHTDTTAEATIKAEFQDREKEVKAIKLKADLIYNKASVCEAYINIVKKVLH